MKNMKNIKLKFILFLFGVTAYLLFGFVLTHLMATQMSQNYFTLLGTKALDLARIAAKQISINDKDVLELKALTYKEMLNHPVQKKLHELFSSGNFSDEVKYAYLWVLLDESEVKYKVSEEDREYYNAPVGTPLNLMWLLDVTVNKNLSESTADIFSEDKKRYTIARPYDFEALDTRSEFYKIDGNEYGKVVVAYVPFYTKEKNFIGCLNIDIFYDTFEQHVISNRNRFSLLFIVPTVILTIVYTLIYLYRIKESDVLANTDPLTTLYNRRFLERVLPRIVKAAYKNSSCLSVIMADIDFFKLYNDNYGHKAGDEVIVRVAHAIKSVTRKDVDFVCRYGGEEIIVIIPNTNPDGAATIAKKIKSAVENMKITHEYNSASEFVTISQGIFSGIPESSGKDACAEYIVNADKALYEAKSDGRNCYKMFKD